MGPPDSYPDIDPLGKFATFSDVTICDALTHVVLPSGTPVAFVRAGRLGEFEPKPLDKKETMSIRRDWQYIPPRDEDSIDTFDDFSCFESDADQFSMWLEERLEQLEERHRKFWTRQSVTIVLITYCHVEP